MVSPRPAVLLLALDTSGSAVTAAVHDGSSVLASVSEVDQRRHAELTAEAVRRVLAEAGADRRDLTGIVVGVGPGPFTGLRVGVVTAAVLGAVLAIPVHGICSLDALAAATPAPAGDAAITGDDLLVVTDARRREVYWATYRYGPGRPDRPPMRVRGPNVDTPADVPQPPREQGRRVTGRGCLLYPDIFGASAGPLDVDAAVLAELAVLDPAGHLLAPEPLYLRRPDAAAPGARKRVLR